MGMEPNMKNMDYKVIPLTVERDHRRPGLVLPDPGLSVQGRKLLDDFNKRTGCNTQWGAWTKRLHGKGW